MNCSYVTLLTVGFYIWIFWSVNVAEIKLSWIFFFCRRLNFLFCSLVNAQKSVYWSAHNMRQIYEILSHDSKICVSIDRMIGPGFFSRSYVSLEGGMDTWATGTWRIPLCILATIFCHFSWKQRHPWMFPGKCLGWS